MFGAFLHRSPKSRPVAALLREHFGRNGAEGLAIAERQFPARVRADLQRAADQLFAAASNGATPGGAAGGSAPSTVRRFCGVRVEYAFDGVHFAGLLADGRAGGAVAPPEYEEVDVGEDRPVRCLRVGLWLLEHPGGRRHAVLLAPAVQHGQAAGVRFQVAAPADEAGTRTADAVFAALEAAVREARCYRGKVLSLEQEEAYSGRSAGIRVHRLAPVARDEVILPARTLDLLDRNVVGFVRQRPRLAAAGLPTKKGLLFHGPPGTGKTHTVRYLAGALPGHTTLLVTAEQVGLLGEYVALARLLQPSIVVIEDADLIARDRESMDSPCAESLLNKLLNEMDGLRESADILFVLTTNRPEALEAALAARPGRVDQAIEFPLPDAAGRDRLVRLYAKGVRLPDPVVASMVGRTAGVSAAFIKELVRRSVQFQLEREAGEVGPEDVEQAVEEMLFAGGALNRRLLGGRADGDASPDDPCRARPVGA